MISRQVHPRIVISVNVETDAISLLSILRERNCYSLLFVFVKNVFLFFTVSLVYPNVRTYLLFWLLYNYQYTQNVCRGCSKEEKLLLWASWRRRNTEIINGRGLSCNRRTSSDGYSAGEKTKVLKRNLECNFQSIISSSKRLFGGFFYYF